MVIENKAHRVSIKRSWCRNTYYGMVYNNTTIAKVETKTESITLYPNISIDI
jgi:hypothetical protein